MVLKDFLFTLILVFLFSSHYAAGQNSTNPNGTIPMIEYQVKPSGNTTVRHLFLLLFGCLLTTFLIIAMIFTYNRVTTQQGRQSSTNINLRSRFTELLQSIGLNNLANRTGLNFFSISNNNHSSTHHHHHRQGESSRTHLNENQDEALLFDDPYADGGLASGMQGSSANPYKSLTLSVA